MNLPNGEQWPSFIVDSINMLLYNKNYVKRPDNQINSCLFLTTQCSSFFIRSSSRTTFPIKLPFGFQIFFVSYYYFQLSMKILQSNPKLAEIERTLSKNNYFSKNILPGFADGVIFKFLLQNQKYPDKNGCPNFYHWYIIMRQFSLNSVQSWIKQKLFLQTQSQKCLMLMSDIFLKSEHFPLKKRKPSINLSAKSIQGDQNPSFDKLKPIDINSTTFGQKGAQYVMIVQIGNEYNIQQLKKKLQQLKFKFKQLKFIPKQKSIYARFQAEKRSVDLIKREIQNWPEAHHVILRASKLMKENNQKSKFMRRTISIR